MRYADCHPKRKHYGLGKCRHCYKAHLYTVNSAAREKNRITCRKWWRKNRRNILAQQRKRYAANRLAERKRAYGYRLRRKYGMTFEQYETMFAEQRGRCAICLTPPTKHLRLAVDHDHKTGRVRGLLCSSCNMLLGRISDSPTHLRNAAKYLEQRSLSSPGGQRFLKAAGVQL